MTLTRRIGVYSFLMILLTSAFAFTTKGSLGDTKYHSQNLSIVLSGTSTLHDWDMKSAQGRADAVFNLGADDKLADVTALNFTLPAESLKSEHSAMDNNAYKALKTKENKTISFVQTSSSVSQINATTYQIKLQGKLTIAGTTKVTDLIATAKYNPADKSFAVSGSKKFNMTEYGVKPPTVMMGTIKTGDAITVTFNTKIIR